MAQIDVIIPTLNRADSLERAISSARDQKDVVVNLFVVDQGSTDGTESLLYSLGVSWAVESTLGAGAARKSGLRLTSSPLVLFLDSDDFLLPGALSCLSQLLESSVADIAFGASIHHSADIFDSDRERNLMLAPLTSATLVSRAALEGYGSMADDNISFPRWIIAARKRGLKEISTERPVCVRWIHDNNLSRSSGSSRNLFDLVRFHRDTPGN